MSGQYVGGIIGKNDTAFNSSEMLLSNVGSVFDSSATYVGGIIGENNAQITALKANISGTVSGDDRVGGFAGITTQPISGVMLSNDNNGITVQGNTNVGGWFGEIAKNGGNDYTFDISNSGNTIKVASVGTNADSSCVGGIAGINNVTIKNANISAVSGFGAINGVNAVGGVAGVNNGTIINVTNEITLAHNGSTYFASNVGGIVGINETTGQIIEDNGSTQNQAIIGGIENVGGIAGTNKGLINGAEAVSGAYVTGKTNVGGIAGYNSGTLKANTVSANVQYKGYNGLSGTYESGTTQEEVLARATWNFGGIAGYNSGTIGGLNDADRNTINGIDVAASTMVGGIVGYNTGTVNKTIVSGNINVVFVGIYSGPMAVSDYEDIYIIGRQYLGTNVGGDSPDERHVRCAIATAIPVFCADQGKIQAYLNAAQITGVTIADYFSSGEDLSYGVAGRAIGYDAGFVATSSGDDILSEDENDSAYRSLLVDTNNQVNRNNVVIKSKQTQIGNTPKLPANITSRFGKLKYITIDENDKAWIVWFEKVSSTSVDGHTEYHASTQLDVAVYETIN